MNFKYASRAFRREVSFVGRSMSELDWPGVVKRDGAVASAFV